MLISTYLNIILIYTREGDHISGGESLSLVLGDEIAEARSGRWNVVGGTGEAGCSGISPSKFDIPVGASKLQENTVHIYIYKYYRLSRHGLTIIYIYIKGKVRCIYELTVTTESRAAMAKISAQETTPGHTLSTWDFMLSITFRPLMEFLLGPAVCSPVNEEVSSRRSDASQPWDSLTPTKTL